MISFDKVKIAVKKGIEAAKLNDDADLDMMLDKFITLLVGSIILPIALYQWFTANTTGWDATAVIVWPIIAILGILSILYSFIPRRGG